jgi:hypothetical protein
MQLINCKPNDNTQGVVEKARNHGDFRKKALAIKNRIAGNAFNID